MLHIRLVGELRLELDGRRLETIASRRARSLLAWLAYHPGLHPRTRVAAVFWPDVLDSSARASLRTTLATLRRELGEEAARSLVAGRDQVGLEDAWIDVREAGRLAAGGDRAAALELCDGDLLTDLDDDWVLEQRGAHRDRVVELLGALGEAADESGDLEAAIRLARRRLDLDPVSEDAARVLMGRLARAGDGAAAVAAYEAFRTALRRELGMAPSAETRALVESLRAPPRTTVSPLPEVLARSDHTPLVGRQEQLAALRDAWRRASAGAAGVVLLAGEAGSGKTRLLTELASTARADGATVLAGRCMEDGIVAFAPFTEALRHHVGGDPGGLPPWVVGELARLLPELEPEAGIPAGEPHGARHRLFEAVAAAIGHVARRTPVLLVVEDLHWADVATLRMLAHVIATVVWAPLLVAGSMRPEEAGAVPALDALLGDLRRERRLERVALGGLSEREAGDLAAAWLGTGGSPPGLTQAVHRRTGGNPLFIEEVVRHLVESDPGRSAEALVAAAATEVPLEVRSVIDRRLARLPEPAGQAVRIAAVAGEDFALADVAAAGEMSDDLVADGLDAAVRAGLVDESAVPGHYRFAHALIREAVLAGMTATRRALLHRRMAEVLEALPGDRRAPELARHLLDARPLVDAATAARFALRAAEQAMRGLAYEGAAELLGRALAGDLDERDPVRAEVLLALGAARLRSGDARSADRLFEEVAELARALDDRDLLARAALGIAGLAVIVGPVRDRVRSLLEEALAGVAPDSPLRPRLLARLAIEVYHVQPATLRQQLSADALAAGRRAGGPALLEALGARHVALWDPDHVEERLGIADELVAAASSLGDREAQLQGVNWRVVDLLELGQVEDARAAIAEHERLADDLRLPAYAWYAPLWRAMLALLAGRLDDAARLSEEGERIGRAARDENAALLFEIQRFAIRHAAGRLSGDDHEVILRRAERRPPGAAWRTWLASIALGRGDVAGTARAVRREVAGLESLPFDAEWLYTVTTLGVLAARIGDAAAAAAVYPRALPYGRRIVTTGRAATCSGSASLSLGLMAVTLGDEQAAVAHLEEAVRRDDELGAVPYAVAGREALADLLEDRDRAAALRREAQAAADSLGLPGDLVRRL